MCCPISAQESKPIKITLPDGKTVEAASWKTTPYEVACGISKGLADNTVIAKVGDRPSGGGATESCHVIVM